MFISTYEYMRISFTSRSEADPETVDERTSADLDLFDFLYF